MRFQKNIAVWRSIIVAFWIVHLRTFRTLCTLCTFVNPLGLAVCSSCGGSYVSVSCYECALSRNLVVSVGLNYLK